MKSSRVMGMGVDIGLLRRAERSGTRPRWERILPGSPALARPRAVGDTPRSMHLSEDRARAVLASNRRWRAVFAALALVVPSLLLGLFRRQELRLRALADHGRQALATVTERRAGGVFYRYTVEGRSYDWNV